MDYVKLVIVWVADNENTTNCNSFQISADKNFQASARAAWSNAENCFIQNRQNLLGKVMDNWMSTKPYLVRAGLLATRQFPFYIVPMTGIDIQKNYQQSSPSAV